VRYYQEEARRKRMRRKKILFWTAIVIIVIATIVAIIICNNRMKRDMKIVPIPVSSLSPSLAHPYWKELEERISKIVGIDYRWLKTIGAVEGVKGCKYPYGLIRPSQKKQKQAKEIMRKYNIKWTKENFYATMCALRIKEIHQKCAEDDFYCFAYQFNRPYFLSYAIKISRTFKRIKRR
jgi:hypothetical protein